MTNSKCQQWVNPTCSYEFEVNEIIQNVTITNGDVDNVYTNTWHYLSKPLAVFSIIVFKNRFGQTHWRLLKSCEFTKTGTEQAPNGYMSNRCYII